jgi:hypothetical protein
VQPTDVKSWHSVGCTHPTNAASPSEIDSRPSDCLDSVGGNHTPHGWALKFREEYEEYVDYGRPVVHTRRPPSITLTATGSGQVCGDCGDDGDADTETPLVSTDRHQPDWARPRHEMRDVGRVEKGSRNPVQSATTRPERTGPA